MGIKEKIRSIGQELIRDGISEYLMEILNELIETRKENDCLNGVIENQLQSINDKLSDVMDEMTHLNLAPVGTILSWTPKPSKDTGFIFENPLLGILSGFDIK